MNSLRQDRRINEFMRTAESYCNLLDDMPLKWTTLVLEQLPKLYIAAQELPKAHEYEIASDENRLSKFRMNQAEWSTLWNKLGAALGESRYYWVVFDPTECPPGEPVCGDIADALADIYRDIKNGWEAWKSGDDDLIPDILFDVREVNFTSHWGPHLLSVLPPLHRLLYEKGST